MSVSIAYQPSLIFDTTVLSHFARADRLDVLSDLVVGQACFTTQVVREELVSGSCRHLELQNALNLDWLAVIALDSVEALNCFAEWTRRMGRSDRNLGEASVFAVAELFGGTPITDDGDAIRVGRAYGLDVHGTIWILAGTCRAGKLTEVGASNPVDALRATQMRLPCTGSEFPRFARDHGLL